MMVLLFWLFGVLSIYSYFIYPIALRVLSRNSAVREFAPPSELPSLTLIVTAYNESKRIRNKIENSLAVDYPNLEIVVASDCSSDDTDEIVKEYAMRGVKLVRAADRLGKENAQWTAIQAATGDVLVFSDVATEIPADALLKLAHYFLDPSVGAISSEDRFVTQGGSVAGEGAYVKYEMWLRRMESAAAGLVGLSGSFFAARKMVCQTWDIHSPSDFNTALNCRRQGYRAVTAPDVLGFYKDLKDPQKEYQRKVRTVLRGITAIARHPDVLSLNKYGLFAFQVWSHKIMRWSVPWFLVLLLICSASLASTHWFFVGALMAQLAFYALALAAHLSEQLKRHALIKIIYFFVQVNIGIADATVRFLSGKRMTTWQPSAR